MDPAVRDLARWFSWRRQRLDRSCRGVEDCLSSVVGVYSANPSGPLSLLARVPRLLKGAAVEGVISTKRALRIPAMRRSIYLVPVETAHLAFWATKTSGKEYEWLLRRSRIDEALYAGLRERILQVARAPMRVDALRAELGEAAPENIGPIVQSMCAEGVLLRIKSTSIRVNDLSYAATDAWLGAPLKQVDPFEALVWLAGDYLTAFGPATAEDFAWWTGVPRGKAADALRAHDPIDVDGGALLHPRDERAFGGTRPHLGRVNLLPKWDCYTMGYAPGGRDRFASGAALAEIYDAGGDAKPVVLVEGEAQGTWDLRFRGERATVRLAMFESPAPRLRTSLEAEAELVGSFLEASSIDVVWAEPPKPIRRSKPAVRSTPAGKETRRPPAKQPPRKKRGRTG